MKTFTFTFTEDERRQIIYACGCAKKQLYEYIELYKKDGDTESVKECFKEIRKYEAMQEKIREAGPIVVY